MLRDNDIAKAVDKSTLQSDKIRITTSNPELKNKIRLDINVGEPIFWCIKFNTPLDQSSVSRKTMNVTDTEGFIMETEISYEPEDNVIKLLPKESYEDNKYYLLFISKKVCSAAGNYLKKEIHIMFKLYHNQISEFKVLPGSVNVPKPKKKTAQMKRANAEKSVSKFYSFQNDEKFKELPLDKLQYLSVRINPLIAIVGVLLTVVGVYLDFFPMTLIALIASVIGMLHILVQLYSKIQNSAVKYNLGVVFFNVNKYKNAKILFQKSLDKNPDNEYAEYALNKMKFYE